MKRMTLFGTCPRRAVACGFLFLLTLSGCSRETLQVLHSPDELAKPQPAVGMRTIRENAHLHQVVVKDGAGHRQTLLADSVWGYRTSRHELYRLYQDEFYEVLQRGAVTIYLVEEWTGDTTWDNYYFSLTPTGTIYSLDRRTVRTVFQNDACMQRLLGQMLNRHLLRQDSHGSYGIANAYSFCHCQTARK